MRPGGVRKERGRGPGKWRSRSGLRQPSVSSSSRHCCCGDNFNNSRGAAAHQPRRWPSEPASPAGWGLQQAELRGWHMPGGPRREAWRPQTHDASRWADSTNQHTMPPDQSSGTVPRRGPAMLTHPKLPALHLHIALLDDVVEIGRHGGPTGSSLGRGAGLGRGREQCPGGPGLRLH